MERLFGFQYQIEIYLPADQRKYGYYSLPFLLDDRLVARVDLKAARDTSTLAVRAAHLEAGYDAREVAAALADELRLASRWQGLERVRVERRGDLAGPLARVLRTQEVRRRPNRQSVSRAPSERPSTVQNEREALRLASAGTASSGS